MKKRILPVKYSWMPWKIYLADLRDMWSNRITERIQCMRGKHRFKMSPARCISCGKPIPPNVVTIR